MPSLPDMMTDTGELAVKAKAGTGGTDLPVAASDRDALVEFLLRAGDNTLVLGHRLSEWCGHAPVLEEDIALTNIALDLIGQTQLWLGLAGEVEGRGRGANDLAYLRDAHDFKNALLVERPNGDFGQTLMRQFLFDAWHLPFLEALRTSSDSRVADIAAKAEREVAYHLERSADLVIRLGDGTAESQERMQTALDALWPYTGELFLVDDVDRKIKDAGIAPSPDALRPLWDETVRSVFGEATLDIPEDGFAHKGGRRGVHTEHLGPMLAEMQFLQRAYPGAEW